MKVRRQKFTILNARRRIEKYSNSKLMLRVLYISVSYQHRAKTVMQFIGAKTF